MHAIVIGGGIIGVTTAYFLRQAGCEVTLIERNSGVAQETSFANAGIIAPGYVAPWAAPGMPSKVLRYMFRRESPVLFKPGLDPALWRWVGKWLGECTAERFRANKLRMQRVAFHSRAVLHEMRDRLGLYYEQSAGYLQLFRTPQELALSQPARELLSELGVPYYLLDETATRLIEPGISDEMRFAGAIHLPEDEAGNCALFARLLRKQGETDGVNFRFDHQVRGIITSGSSVEVQTDRGTFLADAIVIAAGVESAALAKPLGIRIPLWPVKGYSATVQVVAGEAAPRVALMDEMYKVAITRLGNRVRIAGTAELGNHQLDLSDSALNTLIKVAKDWFPNAANYAQATYWCGARPMLPDGPPLLGGTHVPRVFVNVGHGSTGWAMACGSGHVVADVVTGKNPAIDLDGLTLARYA
jgi:D-amino-acid dehydrogenase